MTKKEERYNDANLKMNYIRKDDDPFKFSLGHYKRNWC